MRVLIADGHDVMHRGLKSILLDAFPGTVFSLARSRDETLQKLAEGAFELLILDINMPGNRGLAVLRDVKRNHPKIPVVVLSIHTEDQYAKRCLRAGAAAYIAKDHVSEELAQSVASLKIATLRQVIDTVSD